MVTAVFAFVMLVATIGTALDFRATKLLPRFEDFEVAENFQGRPVPAKPKSAFSHRFRTVIRNGAQKGPNFAGHYTVVEWGCGTSCAQFVIVDALNGRVFDPPFDGIVGGDEKGLIKEWGLHYKVNSTLFVAQGCPEERNCAVRYYKWNGSRLVLFRSEPVERFPLPSAPEPPSTVVKP